MSDKLVARMRVEPNREDGRMMIEQAFPELRHMSDVPQHPRSRAAAFVEGMQMANSDLDEPLVEMWDIVCLAVHYMSNCLPGLKVPVSNFDDVEAVGYAYRVLCEFCCDEATPDAVAARIHWEVRDDAVPAEYLAPYEEIMSRPDVDETAYREQWVDFDEMPGAVPIVLDATSKVFPAAIQQDEDGLFLESMSQVPPYEARLIADLVHEEGMAEVLADDADLKQLIRWMVDEVGADEAAARLMDCVDALR